MALKWEAVIYLRKRFIIFTLASSGVLKLIIFPNSLAWNTDFTRSYNGISNFIKMKIQL